MLAWFFTTAALATPAADTPLPPIDPPAKLRTAHHEVVIDAPLAETYAWWRTMSLNELAVETDDIPRVERTELLKGDRWQGVGTRRRVHLSDGSTALEEIIGDQGPDQFKYQVFAYTSSAARFVEYGVGEFRLSAVGEGQTKVSWTYQFRPRTLLGQWFLGGWVKRKWSPWMVGYLANMKAGAEAAVR